jgi:hypothetical protein
MPPDRSQLRPVVTPGAWLLALGAWAVALHLAPDVPRAMLEATQLAALYALGRS